MFDNDSYPGKATVTVILVTIIMVILDIVLLVLAFISWSLTNILLALLLILFTWIFYVLWRLFISLCEDVKYIRNRLYHLDKDGEAPSSNVETRYINIGD